MKKAALGIVLTFVVMAVNSSLAQAHFTLHADIPFSFSIDGKKYAAGHYELRSVTEWRVQLQNLETGASGMFMLGGQDYKVGVSAGTPQLRFVVSGAHGYLVSLTEATGKSYQIQIASRDVEATRRPGVKEALVALK